MKKNNRQIGIFGGTFDPIHLGHLIVAEIILEELQLDEIWFLPARYHILKSEDRVSNPQHRLKMVELAVEGNPHFKVRDEEIKKNKISKTFETISNFKQLYPEYIFYFLVGIDAVNTFDKWYRIEDLFKIATIVTFGRPPFRLNEIGEKYVEFCKFVKVPLIEISSTQIRGRIKAGKSIRYFVPEKVEHYIYQNKLYV